jgi:hypothetical protein
LGAAKFWYRATAKTLNIDEMGKNVKVRLNDVPDIQIIR